MPPKIVHFIWPAAPAAFKLDPLLRWQKLNPGVDLILWFDGPSPSTVQEAAKHSIKVEDTQSLKLADAPPANPDKIMYSPVTPAANYGAASDALRYLILEKYGDFCDKAVPAEKPAGGLGDIGNDALIASPANKLLAGLAEYTKANFK